jgi:two-component system, NarL family, nitrate/nitrite response regulator NarL
VSDPDDRVEIAVLCEIGILREGLSRCLAADPRIAVTGELGTVSEAEQHCMHHHPHVLLFDACIRDVRAGVHRLAALTPPPSLLGLGVREDPQNLLGLIEAGMTTYVTSSASIAELIDTTLALRRGEVVFHPRLAASLCRRVAALAAGRTSAALGALTAREQQIARLLADGCSNKDIAVRLGVEVSTAKNHVHNILEKLGLRRRAEIGRWLRTAGQEPVDADDPHPLLNLP